MTDQSVEAVCALCGQRRYHTEVFGWQCPYCVSNRLPGQSAAAQVAELHDVAVEAAARARPKPEHVKLALADIRTSSRYAYAHGNAGVLAAEVAWLHVHVAELVGVAQTALDRLEHERRGSGSMDSYDAALKLRDVLGKFSAA